LEAGTQDAAAYDVTGRGVSAADVEHPRFFGKEADAVVFEEVLEVVPPVVSLLHVVVFVHQLELNEHRGPSLSRRFTPQRAAFSLFAGAQRAPPARHDGSRVRGQRGSRTDGVKVDIGSGHGRTP
jgi:hypothetical protein